MGRNSVIKAFDPANKTGTPLDLFSGRDTRRPVIVELLRSPWIVRGSQVASGSSGHGGKRREEEVEVVWDGTRRTPDILKTPSSKAMSISWAVSPGSSTSRTRFRFVS